MSQTERHFQPRHGVLALLDAVENIFRRRYLDVFYHPAYRFPFTGYEPATSLGSRRVDFALWTLAHYQVVREKDLTSSRLASYGELSLVHTPEYLESLSEAQTLAQIFAIDPSEVVIDEVLRTVRLACGGTIEAARLALRTRRPVLNMLGGFHHAAPRHGGGFCAANDIAIAVAVLRRDGYRSPIAVLDLDAHPPDGTAECLRSDSAVWIGSLSGSDWGPIPGADETVLPEQCGDADYSAALEALLSRMPSSELVFVIAGGDVLAGDRLGRLGLTLEGARRRDAQVLHRLVDIPSVWLPGGGYHPRAWELLAQTGFVLAGRTRARIRKGYDPLASRFRDVAQNMNHERLTADELTTEDLEQSLSRQAPEKQRVLGYYSKEGLEYALSRYGLMAHLEHLGYSGLRVEVSASGAGDAIRILGQSNGSEHALVEAVLERRRIAKWDFLFVNWLALRHPRVQFAPARPRLPGQDAPGLGLAREMVEVLALIARRLNLDGVAFRPSWYHTAYTARYRGRFIDARRQGRFEAMTRDLAGIPLLEATNALASSRVKLNGEPYRWEPDDMAYWLGQAPPDDQTVVEEREQSHFTIDRAADKSSDVTVRA